jgi:hypothetical protein
VQPLVYGKRVDAATHCWSDKEEPMGCVQYYEGCGASVACFRDDEDQLWFSGMPCYAYKRPSLTELPDDECIQPKSCSPEE